MTSTSRLRWLVPAGLAAALGAAVALPAVSATAAPELPARTAAQLLADVSQTNVSGLSGTVSETARLGLPALPSSIAGHGTTSLTSLVSGTNTLRVWEAGPDRQRVALIGPLAEYNVVHNGNDVWTYQSQSNKVTHVVLPAGEHQDATPPIGALTPQQAAEQALAAIDPTTEVTVDQAAVVAGLPAYQLVLTPRDPGTLIGSVRLALDSATKVPLRVQVFARGVDQAAFEVGFNPGVTFEVPDASTFAFTPPAGANVTTQTLTGHEGAKALTPPAGLARPTVIGQGWTSILVAKLPAQALDPAKAAAQDPNQGLSAKTQDQQSALLDQVTTRVPEGRVFHSALVSALLTDDGRLLVGAVPASALQTAARG